MLADQPIVIVIASGRHKEDLAAHAQGIAGCDHLSDNPQLIGERVAAFIRHETGVERNWAQRICHKLLCLD